MSDDAESKSFIERLEKQPYRPLTPTEMEKVRELIKSRWRDMVAAAETAIKGFSQETPEAKFLHKLMTRQGTTMPDFDALYKMKAELVS
jgi:shikimate kinase